MTPASPQLSQRLKHAHAGIAMAAATLAMGAASGIQAVLYLSSFGASGRTDAFFAAFAIYAAFGVFSQSIRVTSVPLLVGDRPRMTSGEFGAALVLLAIPVLIVTVVLAEPAAGLLAPGLDPSDRTLTAEALPLLGVAMVIHLWGAGGATVLAIRDQFKPVALAYTLGAAAGVVTYLLVAGATDELSLAWSTLAGAVVTGALIGAGVWRSRPERTAIRSRPGVLALGRFATLILGRTGVYLALNALFPITLAFTSRYGAGDATVLSYTYVYCSYIVATTAFSLALSRIADMRLAATAERQEDAVKTIAPGFRYSMLVAAPALAVLVAAGAPLAGELLPNSLGPDEVSTMRIFGALLGIWTVAALVVNLVLPALFALGRVRLVNALAPVLVVLHLAATAAGGALFGLEGAVGAAFLAPAAFAVTLVLVGMGQGGTALLRQLSGDAMRIGLPAVLAFLVSGALADLATDGMAQWLATAVVGAILYLVLLSFTAPRQVSVLRGRLRPLGASEPSMASEPSIAGSHAG